MHNKLGKGDDDVALDLSLRPFFFFSHPPAAAVRRKLKVFARRFL